MQALSMLEQYVSRDPVVNQDSELRSALNALRNVVDDSQGGSADPRSFSSGLTGSESSRIDANVPQPAWNEVHDLLERSQRVLYLDVNKGGYHG